MSAVRSSGARYTHEYATKFSGRPATWREVRGIASMVAVPALTPLEFAARRSKSELSERYSYQQHFLDACEMLGAPQAGPA